MKHIGRLLFAAAFLLPWAGGRGLAASVTAPSNDSTRSLEVLATVGPWPTLSALIGYRGRLWFANSVRYPDHNSADLYSLGLAAGDLRFERHLFTQDVGTPVTAGGLLYWPYEDPRPSVGWGHIAVTDGDSWQLRVMPGATPMYHVHAMESLGGRLYAATSAWRAGLHQSTDGGLRWRQIYDHPTPERQVSRIVALAGFGGRLFGAAVERRNGTPRFPLLVLDGDAVMEVPGWPETARTLDLAATEGGVYGLVGEAGAAAFWRTDGRVSERLSDAATMPPLRAFAADADGFWGVSNASGGGALWHSGDGRRWRRVQDLAGGRPGDVVVYRGRVYVSGSGSEGRGILWGPRASSSPVLPPDPLPTWPAHPTPGAVDWTAAKAIMNEAVSAPETYRTRLRDLAYGWALAGPPLGFFEAALDAPFPDRTVAMFGGRVTPGAVNLGRHILLWGMGVAGRGRVPEALLERPWSLVSNRPQKWFDSLPMALFAVGWVGQNDPATVASLIRRLDRAADPVWLRGDIIGALGAVTGKRFGYDTGAWRQWWAEAKGEGPQ
ncbi:MAG: hypothetical protein ACTSQ7_12105 [Alphaproteobacteria bacterium]